MITMQKIRKQHKGRVGNICAVSDISLSITKGEMCAIVGASGSGKSTLLNIVGLLDRPTSGCYSFNGLDVTSASNNELADARNRDIGFVFQSFHLLPHLSAVENVALPLLYRGISRNQGRILAKEALERVELDTRAQHLPRELSGGQQQRVAIARALVGCPIVLLADEPTGSLDSRSSREVMSHLEKLNESSSLTLVIVTHDPAIAVRCHRQVSVKDGCVESDTAAGLKPCLH